MDEEIAPIVESLRDIAKDHISQHGLEVVKRAFAYVNEKLIATSVGALEIEGLDEGLEPPPPEEESAALMVVPQPAFVGDGADDDGGGGDGGLDPASQAPPAGSGQAGSSAAGGGTDDAEDAAPPPSDGRDGIVPISSITFVVSNSIFPTHYNTLFHGEEHLLDMKAPTALTPFSPSVKRARVDAEESKKNPNFHPEPAPPLLDLRGATAYLSPPYTKNAVRFGNFAAGLRILNIERAAREIVRKHHEEKGYHTGLIRGNLSLWLDWLTGVPCTDPNWDDDLRRRLEAFFSGSNNLREDESPPALTVKDRLPTDHKAYRTLVQVIYIDTLSSSS